VTDPAVIPVVDEGLGNSSYLVDLGDGRALAVDASSDLRLLRDAAHRRGLAVAFAADTHLHADFLSGACQLAADDGARILASAGSARAFDHVGLHDGDEVDLGGLRLRALSTPGHTDEHVAFLLLDGDREIGVFTGGSLVVGAAARTDLVDPARTEELARAQYASLRRLMALPDLTLVWPTHGVGSFCSAPPGADRTSTIGRERVANSLVRAGSQDAFVTELLASLGNYPPYFRRLGEINRQGPDVLAAPPRLAPLGADQVDRLRTAGGVVVDVRPIDRYAAAHIPGSISIELRDVFATWLGWLVPFDAAPVIVRDVDQDPGEVAWQAAKIGYRLAGELTGGIDAWVAGDRPTASTQLVGPDRLADMHVLDIRQHGEYAAGHVPGATHIELGAIADRADDVPPERVVVMCGHGERAMSAASVIERDRGRAVAVLIGGPADWAALRGEPLETGP
jgi:glyoxylase-like metal-dependent hydrolase (beta-lactamase superfamily II)/rhodanese-related sulfurtransferase